MNNDLKIQLFEAIKGADKVTIGDNVVIGRRTYKSTEMWVKIDGDWYYYFADQEITLTDKGSAVAKDLEGNPFEFLFEVVTTRPLTVADIKR